MLALILCLSLWCLKLRTAMNQPNTPLKLQRKSTFRFLLMLLLTTLASTLSAQTLHGIVTDGSNHRLKGVSVSLLDSSRLILSFAMSAADGRFSLEVPEGKRGALLRFSRMGYTADTLDLQAFKNGQTVVYAHVSKLCGKFKSGRRPFGSAAIRSIISSVDSKTHKIALSPTYSRKCPA